MAWSEERRQVGADSKDYDVEPLASQSEQARPFPTTVFEMPKETNVLAQPVSASPCSLCRVLHSLRRTFSLPTSS